jgi:hypothetical protein
MLVLALLLLGQTAASAGVLLTSAKTSSAFTFTYAPGGSSTVPVELNDAGATSLTFTTPAAQSVVVTFNGECSGGTSGTYVVAVIVIDGTIATGDGGFRYTRLCRGGEGQTVASRTVFKSLAAGSHTIQVVAAIEGPPYTFYTGTFEKTVLTVVN